MEPLVGWEMRWNEQPVGWALSLTTVTPRDLTEVRGRIHFDRLPLSVDVTLMDDFAILIDEGVLRRSGADIESQVDRNLLDG